MLKRVGLHEIARQAQVSIGTVDRALHSRPGISEATRNKVLETAEKLGYTPNLAARALAVGRSGFLIGVCIPEEIHHFFDELRGWAWNLSTAPCQGSANLRKGSFRAFSMRTFAA